MRCLGPVQAGRYCLGCEKISGDVMTLHAVEVLQATIAWREGKPWKAFDHLRRADKHAREEPPISPVQIQLLEAAVVFCEMSNWGPAELVLDPEFTPFMGRALRVAKGFALAFPFGRPLVTVVSALSGTPKGERMMRRTFARACAQAERLGMPVELGRIECWNGLKTRDRAILGRGMERLRKLDAVAEADHFEKLFDDGER